MRIARLICCCASLLAFACSGGNEGTADAGDGSDAGSTGGSLKPGTACTKDSDCLGPNGKCDTRLPGGYCLQTGCTTVGAECAGAGTVCVEGGTCLGACTSDHACGRIDEGYECDLDNSCWYPKYIPVNAGKAKTGAACATGADCESDSCIPEKGTGDAATGYKGGYCSSSCTDDAECATDAKCWRGHCRNTCSAGTACRTGYVCQRDLCLRDPAAFDLGAACTTDASCGGAVCMSSETNFPGFPGGYCTLLWDCDATTGKGCGADAECVSTSETGTFGTCLAKCATNGDCREGYACDESWGLGLCLVKAGNPAKTKLGEACSADADCGTEAGSGANCFKGQNFPGGMCVSPNCVPQSAANEPCAQAGGVCLTVGDSVVGFCFDKCASGEDCREGYACDPGSNACVAQ